MISLNDLYEFNKYIVSKFGGAGIGFKDLNLAESLVCQVDQEVFGEVLYPTIEDKISYLVFSIIANHVFIDGNKRTGAMVLEKLCIDNGIILPSDDCIIGIVLGIAKSELSREDLRDLIRIYKIESNIHKEVSPSSNTVQNSISDSKVW